MSTGTKDTRAASPNKMTEEEQAWEDRSDELHEQLRAGRTKTVNAFTRWGDKPKGPPPVAADADQLKLAWTQHQEVKPKAKASDPTEDKTLEERIINDHLHQATTKDGYGESIRRWYEAEELFKLRVRAEKLADKRRARERQKASIEEGIAAGAHEIPKRVDTRVNDTPEERANRDFWGEVLAEREKQHPEEFEASNAAEALMAMSRSDAVDLSATNASNEGRSPAAREREASAEPRNTEMGEAPDADEA